MARQTWVAAEAIQSVAGTNFATFTTAKTVIPPTSLRTIRANTLKIGDAFEIEVWGSLSNIVTTPGTVVFQVMIGSSIAFTTGVIQLNATAHTNLPFRLRALLTVRAIGNGTTANAMGMGVISGVMFTATAAQVDGVNTYTILPVPATAPAVGAGFNSTIDNVMDLFCGFSISDAGNNVAIQQYVVKSL
ncbi:MAG: hypothetical protein E4G91_09890 [Candidatus Zixiibacteriota bacterium]|nr:MAG: hypothetical protein E4G91_09890 [candidate division Zixibacteria bacterium]